MKRKMTAWLIIVSMLMTMCLPFAGAVAEDDPFADWSDPADWNNPDNLSVSLIGGTPAKKDAVKTVNPVEDDPFADWSDPEDWDDWFDKELDQITGSGSGTIGGMTGGNGGAVENFPDDWYDWTGPATSGEAMPEMDKWLEDWLDGEYEGSDSDLQVEVYTDVRSIFAKGGEVTVWIDVAGGSAPYALSVRATNEGSLIDVQESRVYDDGVYSFSFAPQNFGEHVFAVRVVDANGNSDVSAAHVQVSVHDRERESEWEKSVEGAKLTGDWRTDIVAIAKTQLGYEESSHDFIIDEEGVQRGYTRYGAWYGDAYGEWCAMFVSFCLKYADISAGRYPREADVAQWKKDLKAVEAYRDGEHSYKPVTGDLVFFNWEGENKPQHMGIVERVSDDKLITIEGNASHMVRRNEYDLDDDCIVGYADTTKLMRDAGVLEQELPPVASTPVELPQGACFGYTLHDSVNVRTAPSGEYPRVDKIAARGTEVFVLAAEMADDVLWYLVQTEKEIGYVRADLIELTGLTGEQGEAADGAMIEGENVFTGEAAADALTSAMPQDEDELFFGGESEATASEATEESGENAEAVESEATASEASEESGESEATPAEAEAQNDDVIAPEILSWIAEENPTDEMLTRAMNAGGVDVLVLEGEELVYVRTGKPMAHYDKETGYLIDDATGLAVAYVDEETGEILPMFPGEAQ